jgi:hypothetical protein
MGMFVKVCGLVMGIAGAAATCGVARGSILVDDFSTGPQRIGGPLPAGQGWENTQSGLSTAHVLGGQRDVSAFVNSLTDTATTGTVSLWIDNVVSGHPDVGALLTSDANTNGGFFMEYGGLQLDLSNEPDFEVTFLRANTDAAAIHISVGGYSPFGGGLGGGEIASANVPRGTTGTVSIPFGISGLFFGDTSNITALRLSFDAVYTGATADPLSSADILVTRFAIAPEPALLGVLTLFPLVLRRRRPLTGNPLG